MARTTAAAAVVAAAILAATAGTAAAAPDCVNHAILYPAACCNATAPAAFNVTFNTTVGQFTIGIQRAWSPYGVDRFYNLAVNHYFDSATEAGNDAGFFRVVPGFVVQFGIAGAPAVSGPWENDIIPNDPVVLSNVRGTIAYAAAMSPAGQAVNRTTQVYINYGNNTNLDGDGFTPFGVISEADMAVVDAIYAGYGQQPSQDAIYREGDAYLQKKFPRLDYITSTTVVVPPFPAAAAALRH